MVKQKIETDKEDLYLFKDLNSNVQKSYCVPETLYAFELPSIIFATQVTKLISFSSRSHL